MIYTVLDVAAIIFEMIITFMFYGYFLKRKDNGLFNKGISAILFFVLVVMNNHFVSSRVAMGIVTVLIYFIASPRPITPAIFQGPAPLQEAPCILSALWASPPMIPSSGRAAIPVPSVSQRKV